MPDGRGGALRAARVVALAGLLWLVAAAPARPPAAAGGEPPTREAVERLIGAALASDHAMLRLSQLCDGIGPRIAGSEALDRAVAWATEAMREDGLEAVRTQAAMVPHWVRGTESAEMVAPRPAKLAMLGLGRSVGTPPGGVTADVVVVDGFAALDALPADAVRGHIVLYDVPFTHYGETVQYRWSGPRRAAERGAVAALVRTVAPRSLRSPHTGAMSDSAPRIPAAAISIEDAEMIHRLTARGVPVRVHLEMNARMLPDVISHNAIGEIKGRERPREIVVVGGHLDTWDVGQGAQDDGGGCVIAMEALRLMKQLGLRPRRTVRCVLWVNEEYGNRGGQAYADSLRGSGSSHVAAVESDNGVERPLGFAVGVLRAGTDSTDTLRTAAAVARLRAIAPLLAGLDADRVSDGGGESDIDPLMRLGVPGLSLRTTGEHYFDWHHSEADMASTVDPVELRKNAAALAALVYVLAEMPERLAVPQH